MAVTTQDAAGYYVWEVAGKPVVVHLHLDVVDHLLAVVLRGLGALPKRGAEVGGLLLGSIERASEPGDISIVRIEDFEPVECEYIRGPSYLFTDADRPVFEAACERWKRSDGRAACAVGFYRSHTRDGLTLAPEDLELLDKHFPSLENIALLVKPFRTKLSTAGFFFREAGAFPQKTPLEFPFRRSDLAGEETAQASVTQAHSNGAAGPPIPAPRTSTALAPVWTSAPAFAEKAPPAPKARLRNALWIPLSFVFLLVGLALGLMLTSGRGLGVARERPADPSLGLSVTASDQNISVKWDRQAVAIRRAQRGVIEIVDGGETVSRALDAIELQNGSLIYRNASDSVKFRLTVYPGPRVSVTETAEWHR
ncbi:MAG TPA: hypothetical protein VKR43_23855 [Bryobacteraceae bacterium]|nr:hypothetical protein [Bryobacteraceae bacterium]